MGAHADVIEPNSFNGEPLNYKNYAWVREQGDRAMDYLNAPTANLYKFTVIIGAANSYENNSCRTAQSPADFSSGLDEGKYRVSLLR